MTAKLWAADNCPDAHGFSTIRPTHDDSIDTDVQPIATVYDDAHAAHIVRCVNERDELVDTIVAISNAALLIENTDGPADDRPMWTAIARARAVLAKINQIQ